MSTNTNQATGIDTATRAQGEHGLTPELNRAYLTVRGFLRAGHNNAPAALAALDALVAELDRLRREPDFWQRRYKTQHDTVHRLEDKLAEARKGEAAAWAQTRVTADALGQAEAELERVTRERDEERFGAKAIIDGDPDAAKAAMFAAVLELEAELAAAAGREREACLAQAASDEAVQRLRDALTEIKNHPYPFVGVLQRIARAVLEEGRQP